MEHVMDKETVEEAVEQLLINEYEKVVGEELNEYELKLIKWLATSAKMYSEEDMIEFGFSTYCYISELMGVPFNLISENKLHAMYNFEQFKKK